MVLLEKLTSKTMSVLDDLIKENNQNFNKNFFEDKPQIRTFFNYQSKNTLYFFKIDTTYIGYIWISKIGCSHYKILDIYVKLDYIGYIDLYIIPTLKKKFVIYESVDSYLNLNLMTLNNFEKVKSIKLMERSLANIMLKDSTNLDSGVYFRGFEVNKDEKLRCLIQNDIFYNVDRTPLIKRDIKKEIIQDYYINSLSRFIYFKNEAIGYGQIIQKNNMYLLVNFGIKANYRTKGFGKKLLQHMCFVAKEHGINTINIQVDKDNFRAINLYASEGFNSIGNINTWINDHLTQR